MNKIFLLALAASTFMLVACGDDDSSFEGAKTAWDYLNPGIDYGEFTDARDGQHIQIYKTVEICNDGETSCQTWMAENLNYSVDPGERSWCGGGEKNKVSEGDCSKYGRLYTWTAAVGKTDECGYGKVCDLPSGNVSGVCPEGWHLPSDDEWNTLFIAAGGIGIAGQKLKSNTNLWKQEEGISNDDSFGFAALPAGYRYYGEIFYKEGEKAYFWNSTEFSKDLAFSVRCVKNKISLYNRA